MVLQKVLNIVDLFENGVITGFEMFSQINSLKEQMKASDKDYMLISLILIGMEHKLYSALSNL